MESNKSDSDDEDLEALRLAALATLKPRTANKPKSESPECGLRNAPVIQTALYPRKDPGPSSLPPNPYSWRNNAAQSRRGRGRGGFPKINQRSNLIVITPVTDENDFTEKRETSARQLSLPQHKWCQAVNENSSSPKTYSKRGPTRFNRHESGSESSDSDYDDHSDQDSYSNETILQDENSMTFPDESIDRESTPVTDEGNANHQLNFQMSNMDGTPNPTYNAMSSSNLNDPIQREPMKYSGYQYKSLQNPFPGTSTYQNEIVPNPLPVNGGATQDYDGRRLSESNPEGYSATNFVDPNLSQSDLRLELKKRMLKLRSESTEGAKPESSSDRPVQDERRTSEDSTHGCSRDQSRIHERSESDVVTHSEVHNRSLSLTHDNRSRSQSPRHSDRQRSRSRDRDSKRAGRNLKRDYSGSPDQRRNRRSTRSPDRNGKRSWSRSPVKTHKRISASPTKNNKRAYIRSPEKNKRSQSRSPEKSNKHDYIWSPEISNKRNHARSPQKSNNRSRSRSPDRGSRRNYSRTPERNYKHRTSDSLEITNKRCQSRSPERRTKHNHSPDNSKNHHSPVKGHKRISPPRSSKASKSIHSPHKNRKRSSTRSPNRSSKVRKRSRTRSPVRSRKSNSSRSPNKSRKKSPSPEQKHKLNTSRSPHRDPELRHKRNTSRSPLRSSEQILKCNPSPHRDLEEKLKHNTGRSPGKGHYRSQRARSRSPIRDRWRDSSESSERSVRDWRGKKNTRQRWSRSSSTNSSNSDSSNDRSPKLRSISSVVKPVLSSVSAVSVVSSKDDRSLDSGYPKNDKGTAEEKPKALMSLVKSSIIVGENRNNAPDMGKRLPVHMRLGMLPRNKLIRMTKDVEAAFVNSSSDENGETGAEGKKQNFRVVADTTSEVSKRRVEKSPTKNESKSRRKKTYR